MSSLRPEAGSAIARLHLFQQAANSTATPLYTLNKLLFFLPNHFQQAAIFAATRFHRSNMQLL
jgi:hypothetical protein